MSGEVQEGIRTKRHPGGSSLGKTKRRWQRQEKVSGNTTRVVQGYRTKGPVRAALTVPEDGARKFKPKPVPCVQRKAFQKQGWVPKTNWEVDVRVTQVIAQHRSVTDWRGHLTYTYTGSLQRAPPQEGSCFYTTVIFKIQNKGHIMSQTKPLPQKQRARRGRPGGPAPSLSSCKGAG